ncbi:MAG: family 10 glycosylhydrolase [Porphyromonas sp.]|nr:family 10 glycosylhydrolase [Porphyromonas sp.]
MKLRHYLSLLSLMLLVTSLSGCKTQEVVITDRAERAEQAEYVAPQKELRAAWLHTVFQTEYMGKPREEVQRGLLGRLDTLQEAGFNAVIFQVRPESDAWYYSPIEPWSRFFTGQQGVAPSPLWDPLQFLVEEAHKRNMELHAWINPYRAATSLEAPRGEKHPYNEHPEWFLIYGKQMYYNPSLPAVRNHVSKVVEDLVTRYDIDAIHMDDYFYPYPIAGEEFPDKLYYESDPRGFDNIGDWRRDNVNKLIREMHATIKRVKPYVRFGISPFGIYRNVKSDPQGSQTNGLENYDDLYADALLWDREGWIDYLMPQLYWEMGHKAADYTELAYWWQRSTTKAHYYIGQAVRRTMDKDQLHPKMVIAAETSDGMCMWSGVDVISNYKGIADELKEKYWRHPALIPASPYPESYTEFPEPPRQAFVVTLESGRRELNWTEDLAYPPGLETKYYVVYCHKRGEKLSKAIKPENIVAITANDYYEPMDLGGKFRLAYTVTRVDRFNHEHLVAHDIPVVL